MARKIVVTSGKGGVGKTTVAVGLSMRLASLGERVILCDADFGLNDADLVAGVENQVTYDIVDVIEGRCRAKQALVRHPSYPSLYILSSAHSAPERYISPQALRAVLDALSPAYDYVVIDCPAGIDEGFHRAVAAADEAVVVATPDPASVRDADRVVTLLKSYALKSVALVVNRVRGEQLAASRILSPEEIEQLLKIPLLGVLPEEDEVAASCVQSGGKAWKWLAGNLRSDKKKIFNPAKKYDGVLGELKRLIKGGGGR